MDYADRQTLYHRVDLGLTVVAFISLLFLIYSACKLYVTSNEQVESPGSHLFHSFAAGVASIGTACFGQAEIAVPAAVDSVSQLFDFFGASSQQTEHERRVAAAEDMLFWSVFFLVISGGTSLARKKIEVAIESSLLHWKR